MTISMVIGSTDYFAKIVIYEETWAEFFVLTLYCSMTKKGLNENSDPELP